MDYFVDPEFTSVFQDLDKSKLAVVAALPVMKDFVETFDQSIKALKSNSNYGIEEQISRFKQMLEKYLMVLKTWAPLTPKEFLRLNTASYSNVRFKTIESYLDNISLILQSIELHKDEIRKELLPSDGFEVGAVMIGSAAWQDEASPKTYEDIFTTIHQNLKLTTSAFSSQLSQEVFPIPASIKKIREIFGQDLSVVVSGDRKPSIFTPSITGVKLEKGSLLYTYNIPLRLHSAVVEIAYNKKDDNIRFTFKFYGDHQGRWKFMSKLAQQAALVLEHQLNTVKISKVGMSFDLVLHGSNLIQDPTILNRLHALWENLMDLSFRTALPAWQFKSKDALYDVWLEQFSDKNKAEQKIVSQWIEKRQHLDTLVLFLLGKQVEKGNFFVEAIKAAVEGFGTRITKPKTKTDEEYKKFHETHLIRIQAKKLFLKLFQKNRGFKEAAQLVFKDLMQSDKESEHYVTGAEQEADLKLYAHLFQHEQGVKEVIDGVFEYATDENGENDFINHFFKVLLDELAKKELKLKNETEELEGYTMLEPKRKAIEVESKALESGIELCRQLVKKRLEKK
jgi:hypothetical protein